MQNENHLHGLQHDLDLMCARLVARRRMLTWIGATGLSTVSGAAFAQGPFGGRGGRLPNAPTGPMGGMGGGMGATSPEVFIANGACIADPAETNGPYPSDGSNTTNGVLSNILSLNGVVRSDIRPSIGSTKIAAGIPLTLTLNLVNVNNNCAPLAGYAIYIWHCDADGKYSLYDLPNDDYLRGMQIADANGQVTFTTIFPGCYTGRYPHIHFEVYPSVDAATSYRNAALTSQLTLPADTSASVYATADGYSTSAVAFTRVSLAGDNVFGGNTAAQIEAQTLVLKSAAANSFSGTANIGLVV